MKPLKMATSAVVWCMAMLSALRVCTVHTRTNQDPSIDSSTILPHGSGRPPSEGDQGAASKLTQY